MSTPPTNSDILYSLLNGISYNDDKLIIKQWNIDNINETEYNNTTDIINVDNSTIKYNIIDILNSVR